VTKSRKIRWEGHVERIGDRRRPHRILVGRPAGRDHLEDLAVDQKILKRTFKKWDGLAWIGLICLRI
jgi:hypothetical protein